MTQNGSRGNLYPQLIGEITQITQVRVHLTLTGLKFDCKLVQISLDLNVLECVHDYVISTSAFGQTHLVTLITQSVISTLTEMVNTVIHIDYGVKSFKNVSKI